MGCNFFFLVFRNVCLVIHVDMLMLCLIVEEVNQV